MIFLWILLLPMVLLGQLVSSIGRGLRQLVSLADEHDGFVTALGTIAIAIFTWRLWVTSNYQWRTMSQDTHHNDVVNRAFISMQSIEVSNGKDKESGKPAMIFYAQWLNSGNTPAVNVTRYFNLDIRDHELPKNFDFADLPPKDIYAVKAEIGRGLIGPHDISGSVPEAVLQDDIDAVDHGDKRIYFWGWIAYDDSFGCPHRTEFCRQLVAAQRTKAAASTFWFTTVLNTTAPTTNAQTLRRLRIQSVGFSGGSSASKDEPDLELEVGNPSCHDAHSVGKTLRVSGLT